MLHHTVKDFFSKYYNRHLRKEETLAIEFAIASHGINENGKWLIELFEDLQGKRLTKKVELTEATYPNGDNGFSNLLADLNTDFGFDLGDYADYGEGIEWTLGTLGLRFFLCREGLPDYYHVERI